MRSITQREEGLDVAPLAWSAQTGLRNQSERSLAELAKSDERSPERDLSGQAHAWVF